jgi:hypothetical protein
MVSANNSSPDQGDQGVRFQIGNNRGRINGWVGANGIFGKCVKIE